MSGTPKGEPSATAGAIEPAPTEPSDPAGQLYDRAVAVRDVFVIMRNVGVDAEDLKLRRVAAAYAECAVLVNEVRAAQEKGQAPSLEPLERAVGAAEAAAISLDQQVPMEHFSKGFDRGQPTRSATARYARLLAAHDLSAGRQQDRYEFLITRLLRCPRDDWGFELIPRTASDAYLSYATPSLRRPRDRAPRAETIGTLEDAVRQVEEAKSFDHLIASGSYRKIYDFKRELGERLVDLPTLLAVARVNIALANKVQEGERERIAAEQTKTHAAQDPPPGDAFAGMLGEMDADERFRQERRKAQAAEPDAAVDAAAAPGTATADDDAEVEPQGSPPATDRAGHAAPRQGLRLALVAVAGAAFGFSIAVAVTPTAEQARTSLAADELAKISPLLRRGEIIEPHALFVGDLDQAAWLALGADQREQATAQLRRALSARGIDTALVKLGDRYVLELSGGRAPVVVQPTTAPPSSAPATP